MYHSDFFYQEPSENTHFYPYVLSAWQVITDRDYHYVRDEAEKNFYPEDTYVLVRTVHGTGQIYTKTGTLLLEKNSLLCSKLKDILRYQSITEVWKYNWVNYTSDVPQTAFEMNKLYFLQQGEFEELIFQTLLKQGKSQRPYPPQVNGTFLTWFYHLYTQQCETIVIDRKSSMVNRIKAYIEQNMFTKLTVSKLAEEFHFSPRRIDQIFQHELHMTPKQYLCAKKLEKAQELLTETQITIKEIANILGYSSPYHFSMEFKSHIGIPPKDYRREKQSQTDSQQILR